MKLLNNKCYILLFSLLTNGAENKQTDASRLQLHPWWTPATTSHEVSLLIRLSSRLSDDLIRAVTLANTEEKYMCGDLEPITIPYQCVNFQMRFRCTKVKQ